MPLAPSPEIDQRDTSQILQDSGIYVLMDEVSDESIKPIIEWILLENHVTQKKKIAIFQRKVEINHRS